MAELSYPTLPVPSQLNDSMDVLSDVGDEWDNYSSDIATLGLSWNFSLAEILASLCLQDRPQSGNIITRPASQPASQSPTLKAQTS